MNSSNGMVFIALYIIVALIGFEGWMNFGYTDPASWYSRSGALLTLIGLYAELKLLPVARTLVQESNSNKHAITSFMIAKSLVHITVIHGTIVWAYGDLFYYWLQSHSMFMFVAFILWLLFFIGWLTKRDLFSLK